MTKRPIQIPAHIDMDTFISTHAHDLRTPFNHITGFSKMLINTVGDAPLDENQKDDLGTIYRSAMRALVLMNGVIDIARFHCGEKTASGSEVNINGLLKRGQAQWNKFYPGSLVKFEIIKNIPTETIPGDELLLLQLVINAVALVTSFYDPPAKVLIRVEEETEDLVYTFVCNGSKSRAASMLDLDLYGSICQEIITLHNGTIHHAEESESGAEFQISLPK